MPSPVGLVVKNGWNSLSLISGGMPVPLSRTLTSTASSASRVATARTGWNRAVAVRTCPLVGGVKAVAKEVEEDAGDVLRDQFDWLEARREVALQGDVEVLVLGAGTVIGEVERLLDQSR